MAGVSYYLRPRTVSSSTSDTTMSKTKNTSEPSGKSLQMVLQRLRPTGWDGFEGLVVTLLRQATGLRLALAASGLQGGLDAATLRRDDIQVAVECKRYGDSTPLSEQSLRTAIEVACSRNAKLDCWVLVTSREITTQEDVSLSQACNERGIAYLSLATMQSPSFGYLDVLCAAYEDSAVAYLEKAGNGVLVADFRQAVSEVRARGQYGQTLDALKSELCSADIGFRPFVDRLNECFVEDSSDPAACKRRFRCALTPAALHAPTIPQRRGESLRQLQALWDASHADGAVGAVLVLGDEGTGKSWVVSDWIRGLVKTGNAPAVFFIPAGEPDSKEVMHVLTKHARQFVLARSTDLSVQRKLQRWLHVGVPASSKRAVVVLDGINERPEAALWADLIEELNSSRLATVFLIVTCRSKTWKDRFSKQLHFKFSPIEVGDFSEAEFEQAISELPRAHQQAIRSAGSLVRRPRFFHLALQQVASLPPGEELTAETLYYFDWQHRESLKRGMAIDGTGFADAIRSLARDQRVSHHILLPHMEAALGVEKFAQRQEELASTGIIERVADGWRLKREYFALGLGMYLADRVEQQEGTVETRCAAAEGVLADTVAVDLTTSVFQHALLHSLFSDPPYSQDAQVALLSVWANTLNSANELGESLPRLQITAELLLGFADYHWRHGGSAHVMEQAVLSALVRIMRAEADLQVCLDRLVQWAGLVHENGESEHHAGDRPCAVVPDVNRLCGSSKCDFPVSKVTLAREERQPALRLGRLAIAAVSACSLRAYWHVVVTAFVADQALEGPRTELLAWLIRGAHEPIDDLVDRTTSALLADTDPVCCRAAQRMISILGSQALLPRLDAIAKEHFPVNRLASIEEEMDSCRAFFRAPSVRELPGCLAREDVPQYLKVSRGRVFAADRTFPFPDVFAAQIATALDAIDASRLWRDMGKGDADCELEQLLPLGFRLAPDAVARLVRRIALDCRNRSGLPLRQASFGIQEFSTLLDANALSAVRETWCRICQSLVADLPDACFVESQFAQALLEHLSGPEQLEFLRWRGAKAAQPRAMSLHFKQLAPVQQEALKCWRGDAGTLQLALWFLSAQRELEPSTAFFLAEAAMASSDSATRGLALKVALRLEKSEGMRLVGMHQIDWQCQETQLERYWRTLATIRDESPTAQAQTFVSPAFMGQALVAVPRAMARRWVPFFAELLHGAATGALAQNQSPSAAMDVLRDRFDAPWIRVSAPRRERRRYSMVSPLSIWGGLPIGDLRALFSDDDYASATERDTLDAALAEAHASGVWLYGAYIPGEAIGLLIEAEPSALSDLACLFSRAARCGKLPAISALVEAALEWGLSAGCAPALQWFDQLEEAAPVVRYWDSSTRLLRRHAALAKARPGSEIQRRWRRLIGAQQSDLDLYRVLNAIAVVNSDWLLEEAKKEFASNSPRGRAIALLMTSALDDNGVGLAEMESRVCGHGQSWYHQLAEMSWQYLNRGRDQRHWLADAVRSENPVARARGAFLFEYLSHPRGFQDLERMIDSQDHEGIELARVGRLPPSHGHSRQLSEWTRDMSQRLFGGRVLEYAIAPWLPGTLK